MLKNNEVTIRSPRMLFGLTVFIIGLLSPLLIPFVTKTDWSLAIKATLGGLLAFGIPEIFMIIAVSIMGKTGYELIKKQVLSRLSFLAPSDSVSLFRYRIGLVMFCLPIIFGILYPYLKDLFDVLDELPLWIHGSSDFIFLLSLFVLGGNFWDKFRSLFIYDEVSQ